MPTLGAQRAGHPELRLPLRRKHDEDHDDQQHAGRDREDAEDQKEGQQAGASIFRLLQLALFVETNAELEIASSERFLQAGHHRGCAISAIAHATRVGDDDGVDLARTVQQALQRA